MAQMNPDLKRERKGASFDVRLMTHLLDGGAEATATRERFQKLVADEPVFANDDKYFLSRVQNYERVLQKVVRGIQMCIEHNITPEDAEYLFHFIGEEFMVALHWSMFIPTLQGQATNDQKLQWLPLAQTFQIIGCYAQTEMGHGSNVRGLETTATYDKTTQEFVLHSPTLTSTKWWPGGLGKTSTHCVTHARLLVEGKDHGVATFIVQIRSTDDHAPMPGVTVGDIGPKFGYDTQDNGFLRFDHVRIPRDQMLMKYKQVSPEGVVTEAPKKLSKLSYGTMMYIRSRIVGGASSTLARACTIAVRYSAVRRQFSDADNEPEKQVLDYRMQQYRLLPLLATAYAFHFTGRYMRNIYDELMRNIQSDDVSALPEVHATSAGLKAVTTWMTADGIEECRKCCGGHGYSKFAGISDIYVNYVPACTYEGDNVVMCLQTARYLVKTARGAAKGEPLVGSVQYLAPALSLRARCPAQKVADFLCPRTWVDAFALRARFCVFETVKKLDALKGRGLNDKQVWNEAQIDLVKMTKAHCYYTIVRNFANAVEKVEDKQLQAVLHKLCMLFALYQVQRDLGDFTCSGYLAQEQVPLLNEAVEVLLSELRKDAVPLVDSFDFSDHFLNSSLGRYNGDVYEHMYKWAQKEPLNQAPYATQPPGYEKYLKRLLNGEVLQEAIQNKMTKANL